MLLVVPEFEEDPWPTLGPQVCDFLVDRAVHGPGDLKGKPAQLDSETRALIYRAYEVYPPGHELAGRRRFKRVGISLRKGTAKTEKAAWIAYVELHPEGPVRCDGFDAWGRPVGRPVRDPYIPMLAYTEEQTEELAYGALYVVVTEGPDADLFDVGLERIVRLDEWGRADGKAEALAGSPNALDGARTTHQHFDETHRLSLPRLRDAHQTMLANIPKRPLADPWSLETTTAPEPGAGSVAESTMAYAEQIAKGKVRNPTLFFFHRQASKGLDECDTEDDVRVQVLEASGPAAAWSDINGIVELYRDPTTDLAYWERVWLNRKVAGARKAFDRLRWDDLADPGFEPAKGDALTLGFDGSRWHDATALVATHVERGWQWPLAVWECPYGVEDWEVPVDEVDAVFDEAMERFDVVRAYADPPYWTDVVAAWAGRYPKVVMEWWTNRLKAMAYALREYDEAQRLGNVTHSGDVRLADHIGNAYRRLTNLRDDEGRKLWVIHKERPDSPNKIDAAMSAALSWKARTDAIADGALNRRRKRRTGFG